jgi:hypothetical protein
MTEHVVRQAVCTFQAARVGHDEERKSEAALRLAKTAEEYLSAGGQNGDDQEKLLQGLAMILNGQDGQ